MLVGHLLCILPLFQCGFAAADGAMGAGGGAAEPMAPLKGALATSGTFAVPLERGRFPIPGTGRGFQPEDDVLRGRGVLAVQGPAHDDALNRLGHVEPTAA